MEIKICPRCQVSKNIEDFSSGYCKDCQRAYAREYRKKYYQVCKDEIITYTTIRNKEVYNYKYQNKNKAVEQNTSSPTKAPRGKYKKRFHEPVDPKLPKKYPYKKVSKIPKSPEQVAMDKLKISVRKRMYKFLKIKKWIKRGKFKEYVGCTILELKSYLEKQFQPGMNWEQRSLWHIDHIIPLSSAKTPDDLYKLLHYTNLQPLWAVDNLRKGKKIPLVDSLPELICTAI